MYTPQQNIQKIILVFLTVFTLHTAHAQTLPDNLIKKNIQPIASPLKSVLQLEPRTFEYDSEKFKGLGLKNGLQYGFLADNMGQVFPGMLNNKTVSYMYGKNNYRHQTFNTINEVSLIPVLVASIQELNNEIEQIKLELKELKRQIK